MAELPNARLSERVLLSRALQSVEGHEKLSALSVSADDFYLPPHKAILDTIERMAAENIPISRVTIIERLRRENHLEAAGSEENIDSLIGEPYVPDNVVEQAAKDVLEAATRRRMISDASKIQATAFDMSKPTVDLLDDAESRASKWRSTTRTSKSMHDLSGTFDSEFEKVLRGEGSMDSLGIPTIDRIIGGLHKNSYVVIAGRPGDGKSSLLRYIAHRRAVAPSPARRKGFVYFTLEESPEEAFEKLMALETGIPVEFFTMPERAAKLTDEHKATIRTCRAHLEDAPLYIEAISNLDVNEIAGVVRKRTEECLRDHGVGMSGFGLDYIQLMGLNGRASENRANELSIISRKISQLRMDDQLDMPAIVAAQVNRNVINEQRKPRLADMKDSGSIEQDATLVLMPYIPLGLHDSDLTAYRQNLDSTGTLKASPPITPINILIAKNRRGATGEAHLLWNKSIYFYMSPQDAQ